MTVMCLFHKGSTYKPHPKYTHAWNQRHVNPTVNTNVLCAWNQRHVAPKEICDFWTLGISIELVHIFKHL